MIYKMYSIFDRVTGTYGEPFLAVNDEDCKRKTAYSMRNNPYKDDLCLYAVGIFDVATGDISCPSKPEFVCNLNDCYSEVNNE